MTQLSDDQVYSLARSVGLTRGRAIIATAVAHPESGLETTAHNTKPPDDSYGLWQINMLGALGPARRIQFGITSNDELFDPRVNARAMRIVSGAGLNFGPWTGYTSGAYKSYLDEATAAANRVDPNLNKILLELGKGALGGLVLGPIGTFLGGGLGGAHGAGVKLPAPLEQIAKTLEGIGGAIANIGDAVKWLTVAHNWWRIAGVVAGGLLLLIAIRTLLEPVVGPAVKTATKAAGLVALA